MPIIEKYGVRPMEVSDLSQVLEWRNSPRIRASMYSDQLISMEAQQAWFERIQFDPTITYLIFEYENKPAGVVNFTVDRTHLRAYWGFYLGSDELPTGSGTVMGYMGCNYAFEELSIRKLCGEAFAFNQDSVRFHLRLGFIQEGQLFQHVRKNDNYEDIILFGQLDEQWKVNRDHVYQIITQTK
jgi:UDP-4-amino-4,6-dideoxy-N-acetyl-beta-L-altrosamine N-acetyltransferase